MKIVGIDAPDVEQWAAVELMVHHLQLAAMYFEAIPDDMPAVDKELRSLIGEDDRSLEPALVWLARIDAYYEAMKERD